MQRILKNKKGFTLIELIIVMGIISILSVILFRTFATISELAFRVEQEKNVTQEIIGFSQILQNYADRNTIDFDRYRVTSNEGQNNQNFRLGTQHSTLVTENGLTSILYLSGQDGHISFYSSGDCIQPGEAILSGIQESQCSLYVDLGPTKDGKSGQVIQLTNPKKTYLSQVIFKVIPFASEQQYLAMTGDSANDTLIYSFNKPGFRLFTQVRNARYSPTTRGNNVEIPVQQFFSLK